MSFVDWYFGAILGASCRLEELCRRFAKFCPEYAISVAASKVFLVDADYGLTHFVELVTGMLFFIRFRDDFCSVRQAKNEQKCGSVCSDSIFCVRNIRSIFATFLAGFSDGLGSILGGFWSHVGVFWEQERM